MFTVESPSQILTPREWRARCRTDQASGTLEAPRTLYLTDRGTTLGPALLVEPWPLEQRLEQARTAGALIRGDRMHREDCGRAPFRVFERDSCGTCALLGWGSHAEEYGAAAPNWAGWARVYVQAREPIPRAWLPAFVASLNDAENTSYRDALRRDVATYGWRLTDERPGYRLRTPSAESVTAWLEHGGVDYHGSDATVASALRDIAESTGVYPDDYPADVVRAARRALERLEVVS